eukprot:TRINITY_DN1842_c0_g4_i7.p1 TRINITY_DN1842_c0_g4~~TRINITY_DN1842_c0_g4_i7.p1  ORF type:complete len:102 (+),score=5.28 TRINITY_DN1842_c0_g4_i7:46-351(+)
MSVDQNIHLVVTLTIRIREFDYINSQILSKQDRLIISWTLQKGGDRGISVLMKTTIVFAQELECNPSVNKLLPQTLQIESGTHTVLSPVLCVDTTASCLLE